MKMEIQHISTQAYEWDIDQAQEPGNKATSRKSQAKYVVQIYLTKKSEVCTRNVQKENSFVGEKLDIVEPVK